MDNRWVILNYEIQMYLGARHLQGYPVNVNDGLLTILQVSALTEVKVLHIRLLADIFLGHKEDDISIDDMLPTWREKNVIIANELNIAYTTPLDSGHPPKWYLNKFLAHPDKRRQESFVWAPIIDRMDKPLKNVFRTLPKENLFALTIFQKYLDV